MVSRCWSRTTASTGSGIFFRLIGSPVALANSPKGSLLARLLEVCFLADPDAEEKVELLAEIAGAAALGYGTGHIAPKAAILFGRTAENGKSQVLDMLRGLLPVSAVSCLPPTKFGDDRHLAKLVGKLLNTSDELGSAQAIASDGFKAVITGGPVTARDVYRPAIGFRSQAQHVFACNQLLDGIDWRNPVRTWRPEAAG
jgi:phage/plasmid-associated DNA primase